MFNGLMYLDFSYNESKFLKSDGTKTDFAWTKSLYTVSLQKAYITVSM